SVVQDRYQTPEPDSSRRRRRSGDDDRPHLSLEQGLAIRDQWRDGSVTVGVLPNWIPIYPQLLDPTPAVVANPEFRRALTHALDRKQMADDIQAGLVPVADAIIAPTLEEWRDIEPT